MPRVRRERSFAASTDATWEVLSDPHHQPRWWPQITRVEEVSSRGFTQVLQSGRGRAVRADFTIVAIESPCRIVWRQELAESPFERILRRSETELTLEPEADGRVCVTLTTDRRMRGIGRLGGIMVRRATGRQLDDALAGLEAILAEP